MAPPSGLHRPAPGRLPSGIAPTAYDLHLTVDPRQERYSGSVIIHLSLEAASAVVHLHAVDMDFTEVRCEGAGGALSEGLVAPAAGPEAEPEAGERVVTCGAPIGPGEAKLHLSFTSPFDPKLAGLYRASGGGHWYAYTQFEAADARKAFPCLDEPGWKVPFRTRLTVPEGMLAVSNTPEVGREAGEGVVTIRFAESRPLPTYLVALAVGPMDAIDGPGDKPPLRAFTPAGKGARAAAGLKIASEVLPLLEAYFDRPYPYAKLDQVALLEFSAGAMENAGLITYREEAFLIDPATTSMSRERGIAGTITHELAHQWFGNLVTMAWWDDLWLNEAFATWITTKIIDQWHPHYDSAMELLGGKLWVFGEDTLASARAVRQPVRTVADAENAFDGLTYVKGASVISMIEQWFGEEAFRAGVRDYIKAHEWGNATGADLFDALDRASGKDATAVARSFLDRPGVPLVRAELSCEGAPTIRLSQSKYRPLGSAAAEGFPGGEPWRIPVCVGWPGKEGAGRQCALMTGATLEVPLPESAGCPAWIHPNTGEGGYYRWVLPGEGLQALVAARAALTVRERMALLAHAGAALRAGMLDVRAYMGVLEAMAEETERPVLEQLAHGVSGVARHWEDLGEGATFRAWVNSVLGPAAERLGWLPREGEDEDTTLVRPTVLGALASHGPANWVLGDGAAVLASEYLADPSSVPADVAPVALRLSAHRGDLSVDQLVVLLEEAESPAVRINALRALGSLPAEGGLDAALALLLDPRVRAQDLRYLLFAGIEGPPKGRDRTFDFLTRRYSELAERLPSFGWGSTTRLPKVIGAFCTPEGRDRAKAFFETKASEASERFMAQGLEAADQCIAVAAAGREGLIKALGPSTEPVR